MKNKLNIAFKKTLPIMAGYLFLGSAFGILISSYGFSIWIAFFMSVFIYAGAMQFASIPLLLNPISLFQTFLLTLSINIRHIFYGLSMLKPFKAAKSRKPYMIFALTDESYSLLINEDDIDVMFYIELLNQMYWVFGTIIGYIFKDFIPFNIEGIEFSMTALFIIIFLEKLYEKKYEPLFIGLFSSVLSLLIFKSQNFILFSMIFIMSALIVRSKKL